MYLAEFAEQRGVKPNTVAVFINRHPEIAALTSMEGKAMVLSEEAVELLDKQYPVPTPVQIIENRERIDELQRELLIMTRQNNEYLKELRKADEFRYRLEASRTQISMLESSVADRDEWLHEAEEQLSEEKAAHQTTADELKTAQQELEAAKKEIERLKNRSLWERLTNK